MLIAFEKDKFQDELFFIKNNNIKYLEKACHIDNKHFYKNPFDFSKKKLVKFFFNLNNQIKRFHL